MVKFHHYGSTQPCLCVLAMETCLLALTSMPFCTTSCHDSTTHHDMYDERAFPALPNELANMILSLLSSRSTPLSHCFTSLVRAAQEWPLCIPGALSLQGHDEIACRYLRADSLPRHVVEKAHSHQKDGNDPVHHHRSHPVLQSFSSDHVVHPKRTVTLKMNFTALVHLFETSDGNTIPDASWRNMFVTFPPIRKASLTVCYRFPYLSVAGGLMLQSPSNVLHLQNDEGVL
jgi:hypothetical protein